MTDQTFSRGFAHVGLTVPDIEEAIEWYVNVFDWTRLSEPRSSKGNEGYAGRRAVDLLGEYEEMKVAHLLTGNGVGVEFFEFKDADSPADTDPKLPGFFHICVVDPDVESLATKIDRRGGDHYSDLWQLYKDDKEYLLTYCKDPFGNRIEIYSHSHEQMYKRDARSE